ncbi:hypothetical protein CFC21_104968 [Triticum aestivum]|uniref:Uncharacterized protein n=2 Tax=Triticum aestivum TaxID=4565 RepID=A0A3B6SSQ3_WHEAT|nr:hypothetical protein CFC21_104968 [Triticum aestivum]
MTLLEVGSVPRRRRTVPKPPPAATGIGRHGSADAKGGGGSCGCSAASVAAAAAQRKAGEGGEREGEGKILAAYQSLPPGPAAALRPHVACRRRAQSSPSKRRKKRRRLLDGVFWVGVGMESAPATAADDPSLDEIGVVDGALRDVLRDLGASRPVRVYGKWLCKTDRLLQQHRLLMSRKSWRRGEPFPLDEALTAEEKPSVQVQAFDRRGRPYVLGLKKLGCNDAYRLIAGWGSFLTQNGLDVAGDARAEDLEPAMVELWAFRSPVLQVGVAGQPRGPLGLVVMHYRQGDAPHADAAIAEILATVRNRAAMPPPLPIASDSEPDERTLEAAQGLLMLSESPVDFACRENTRRLASLIL